MADEKLNTGHAENTSPEVAGPITTPEQAAASEPRREQTGPTIRYRLSYSVIPVLPRKAVRYIYSAAF